MSGYEVLVAGEYYCDLIFGGVDAPPRLGQEVVAERLAPGAAAPTTKVYSCLKPSSRCHFASFKAIS